MVNAILLILLVLSVIAAVPSWPYSKRWGDYPASLLVVILTIMIILVLLDRL
jgi:hypothetical protein